MTRQLHGYLRRAVRRVEIVVLVPVLVLAACGSGGEHQSGGDVQETWAPRGLTKVMGTPIDTVRSGIERRLKTGGRPKGITERDWRHVRAIYKAFDHMPVWIEEDGVRGRTQALIKALASAPSDALRLSAYPIAELQKILVELNDRGARTPQTLVEADVMLTSMYVALAEDMLVGQIGPRSISQEWHVDGRESDVDSTLIRTLRTEPLDAGIARMRPQDHDYDGLRKALAEYRQIVVSGGWPEIPKGKSLEPGDTTTVERMSALAARLRREGYLDESTRIVVIRDSTGKTAGKSIYDDRFAGAVAEYQARHAISVDSIMGGETLASLNVPAEYRLRQIAANMERFRWLPHTFGNRYIFVNVSAFRLEAFDGGKPVLESKVIVGSEYDERSTPAFSDSMSLVIFRPYWYVPEEIAAEELWPKQQKDGGYFARNDYEVIQLDGKTRIRQRPGDKNALGYVKFMFPNAFNIYLHDTPERQLFDKDVRAFSHGCIRVERPEELAQFVLGWDADRIREAMTTGKDAQEVKLEQKIPVFIVYLTAYSRGDKLYFGNDLYGRDRAFTRAVAAAAIPDEEVLRRIAELRKLVD